MSDVLYPVDPGPLPPSIREIEDAIVAFEEEFYAVGPTEHAGTPADLVLLGLAERIRNAARTRVASILTP